MVGTVVYVRLGGVVQIAVPGPGCPPWRLLAPGDGASTGTMAAYAGQLKSSWRMAMDLGGTSDGGQSPIFTSRDQNAVKRSPKVGAWQLGRAQAISRRSFVAIYPLG